MIFITWWNFKTMISILTFTFYIINQICFIILYQIKLVVFIFETKYCPTEVLEQPGGGTHALNVMAIRDQGHANVSKQRTLLANADIAPHHGSALIHQNDLCAQRRLRSAWASSQSDQSQRCPPEAKLGPKLPTECTAKTLIRLGGWVDAQADLSLRWAQKSFCWFCHEVAQNASSSRLHMHHIFYISHRRWNRIAILTISYWDGRFIYIVLTDVKLIKLFSLANGTWCAVTVPSFDFVKDDCTVGSAILGKRGYDLNSTQSMVLFHVKDQRKKVFWADRTRSNEFFDGVHNVAACIYYSRKRVSDYCIFNFWCLVVTQKSSHTSQKLKQHISSSSL